MPVTLHCLPYSQPLLPELAASIADQGIPLEKTACVFSSGRAAAAFGDLMAAKDPTGVVAGPYVFTLDEFVLRSLVPPTRPFADSFSRRALLRRAAARTGNALGPLFKGSQETLLEDVLSFAAVGDPILRFFDEVHVERVSFDELRSHSLYSDFQDHVAVLAQLHENYLSVMAEEGFEDESRHKGRAEPDPAFTAGFSRICLAAAGFFTRAEVELIRRLGTRTEIDLYVSHEGPPLPQHGMMAKALGAAFPTPSRSTALPPVTIREFPDPVSQAGFIAEAITSCRAAGILDEDIAVVLPDEGLVTTLTAALGRDCLNIAMGVPLNTSPNVTLLRSVERLLRGVSDRGYDQQDLIGLTTHPMIANVISGDRLLKQETGRLRELIRREHLLVVSQDHLEEAPILREELGRITSAFLPRGSAMDFGKAVLGYLDELETRLAPGFRNYLRLDRDVRSSREVLTELICNLSTHRYAGDLDLDGERTPLRCWLDLLEGETYPAVNRSGSIRVIGLLETRNLRFDAVIVPDLNEGLIPAKSRKDLFLNTALRTSLGLPTSDDRELLYGVYLRNLLCGARRAYLSTVRADDRGLPSRFLEQILDESGIPTDSLHGELRASRRWLLHGTFRKSPPPTPVPKSPAALERLRGLPYTASALQTYLACPYRFYLRYVCRLREPEAPSGELSPVALGNLFHDAIRELYAAGGNEDLFKDAETHHRRFTEILLRHGQRLDAVALSPTNRLTLRNFADRLRAFSDSEVRGYRSGWRIDAVERELEMDLDGLKLRGRIDRIDRGGRTSQPVGSTEQEERFRIIDYKTGTLPAAAAGRLPADGRRPTHIQLSFYLLLLCRGASIDPEQVDDLFFYDLKEQFGLRPAAREFGELGPRVYLERFTDFLRTTLGEMTDPDIPFTHTEDRSACTYCPFDLSCRIAEKGRRV